MNKRIRIMNLIAIGIILNVIGAFIAMSLSIPVYMDSIGTILIAGLLGPKYAMITGLLGSLTSGITFDMYSFYYTPVQLFTGFFAGMLYHTSWLKGYKTLIGNILVSIPTSLLSALITAYLFGGLTSSSSSTFVIIFQHLGLPLIICVFVTQVFTDYIDKLLAVYLTRQLLEKGKLDQKWGLKWKDTAKLQIK